MHIAYIVLNTGGIRIPVDEKVCTCKIGADHDRVNGRNVKP
jgi:hypothetical protein